MSEPVLVVISGPPCSGKTTLGLRLAHDAGLPFFHKDGIKERLFEILGWHDREWSRQLGRASVELLYYIAGCELRAGRSLMLESNFDPELATPRFLALKADYGFRPLQIQLRVEADVLRQRLRERVESGDRHPGHYAHLYVETLSSGLATRLGDLDIGGSVIEVDTSRPSEIEYARLLVAIRKAMRPGESTTPQGKGP